MKQTKSVRSATDNRDGQGQQWPQVVYTIRPLFERNLPKKKKENMRGDVFSLSLIYLIRSSFSASFANVLVR